MKKSIIAVLILVTVFAYAGNGNNGNGHNTQSEFSAVQFDADNHVFNVMESGTWVIQLNQSTSVNGQVSKFGYYVYSTDGVKSKANPFTDPLKGNALFTLPNLKQGEKIEFYVMTEAHGQGSTASELTNFHIMDTPGNSAHGNTTYGVDWTNNKDFSFHNANFTPAPSGQPLPGALTTMLIAGGCAAYLKRKKSARK